MLTGRLYDAQGNLVTDGLIDEFTSFRYSERLDEIGSFDLRLPLAYARSKKYFDVAATLAVSEDFQEFFRGTIERTERNGAEYSVSGSDLLAELRYPEVGASYSVNGALLPDVVSAIIALTEQTWTASTATQSLRVVADFQGKQGFDALRDLMATYGLHLRRLSPSARSIQLASFGSSSGYVLTNLPSLSESANTRHMVSIIDALQSSVDRSQLANRIIAYGATYDTNTVLKLPLANRVETGTIVSARARGDATEHYIENSASISRYGLREKLIRFGEIKPASTSTADVERAEDMLKTRAVAFLTRWGTPITTHRVTTKNFNRLGCRVGDMLTLRYEERASDDTLISVNDDFFLTEVSGSFDASGRVSYNLTLADSNRAKTDDREALVGALKRLEEIKLGDLN